MPSIAPRDKPSKKPVVKKQSRGPVSAAQVVAELEKHILVDGFKLVFDLEKSSGSRFFDAASGRELIDLYSFYASQPIGFNHPHFDKPAVQADLLAAAKIKVATTIVVFGWSRHQSSSPAYLSRNHSNGLFTRSCTPRLNQ